MNYRGPSRPTSLHGEWAAVTSGEVRCLGHRPASGRPDGRCDKRLLRLGKDWKGHVRTIPRGAPLSQHGEAIFCSDCRTEMEIVRQHAVKVA